MKTMIPVKVQNMYEAYQHTLLKILQTPCNINDTDIDTISSLILAQLLSVGKDQCIQTEGLQFQVAPLVQQAKNINKERKLAFKTSERKTRGLHTFSIKEKCEIKIHQHTSINILDEIRSWLCDFGDKYNTFHYGIWGIHSQVGDEIDRLQTRLEVTSPCSLEHEIVIRKRSIGNLWEPDDLYDKWWRAWSYVQVPPIQVEFFFHEPSIVTGSLIKHDIMFTLGTFTFKTSMPIYSETLKVIFEGEFEYTVTRGVYGRRWAKIITFGNVVDKVKTLKKIERVTVSMEYKAEKMKVINRINSESAKGFLNMYRPCKPLETLDQEMLLVTSNQVDYHAPFRDYVNAMRVGGKTAINEMVSKKPFVIKDLPKDINNVGGIAFEELQIAKIMAEAHKKKAPLILHAGDGRSRFEFRGDKVRTPEYVDAVFYNTESKIYYAVQFKFTTDPNYLPIMMEQWTQKWNNKKDRPVVGTVPDAFLLKNVQLIGPGDVVKNKIDVGFEQVPLEGEAVIKFIEYNSEALKNIVNDKIFTTRRIQEKTLRSIDNDVKNMIEKIANAQAELESGLSRAIPRRRENIENDIVVKQRKLNNLEENYRNAKQAFDDSDIALQNLIKREMKNSMLKGGFKQILASTAFDIAINGIIFLATSGYTEIKKYCNDKASARQCVWNILYQTSAGVGRGLPYVGLRNVIEVAGQYAVGGTSGTVLSNIVKLAGPILMISMVSKSAYEIRQQYNDGKTTYTDFKTTMLRLTIPTLFSSIGTRAVQSLIKGPLGVALGAGVFIAVAVGDFYLGEMFWGLFIKEDPAESHAFLKQNENELCDNVLKGAYNLLDITPNASVDELKEQFRKIKLENYQNKEILNAIEAAYSVIKDRRAPESIDIDRRPL